ncbi:MAG TPA: hypothetical protein VGS20_05955 [Candidatus Acidoferrales bacterium]|nr:hypothetical protein [Candidatus Acidoferrales bacterium]
MSGVSMATATKIELERSPGLAPDLRGWIDRVIVPALVRRWLGEEGEKNVASATAQVAKCDRQRPSAEGEVR